MLSYTCHELVILSVIIHLSWTCHIKTSSRRVISIIYWIVKYYGIIQKNNITLHVLSFCLFIQFMRFSQQVYWVCHSLLQWITLCQNSPLWPVCLGWPYMAWLIDSLSYISTSATTGERSLKGKSETAGLKLNIQTKQNKTKSWHPAPLLHDE